MINLCKYCGKPVAEEALPFFTREPSIGIFRNEYIFCKTFLNTHPDYHKLMTNLEYLEWCAEKQGLLNA